MTVFRFLCTTLALPVLLAVSDPGTGLAGRWHGEGLSHEFGQADSLSHLDPDFPPLDSLETKIDLGLRYTRFTGDDMRMVYGGIPVVTAGATVRVSRFVYLFSSLGYGRSKGDPYDGRLDTGGEDVAKIRTVPFQMGLKVDFARSNRLAVYGGFAVEIAWMEEELPTIQRTGDLQKDPVSGTNTGYSVTFGPEFALGDGGNVLGCEIGWGGAKGAVSTEGLTYHLDMTGIRGRAYFALGL